MVKKNAPISKEIREEISLIIEKFNNNELKERDLEYFAEYSGKFLYLKVIETRVISPVVRLTYTGEFDNWEFAIYKWSIERYDPDEFMFPGAQHVNGTIEGAMKAGIDAYFQ